jgi:hypothetical protein
MMLYCSEACTTDLTLHESRAPLNAVCGTGREGTTPVSYRAVHLRITIDMVHITELILREPSTGDNDQRFQKKEMFKRG